MKKFNWKYVFIIIAIIWTIFLATDITMTIKQKDPVFAIRTVYVTDGGSEYYTGMFYTVHKQINNAFTPNYYYTYTIYPWFCERIFDY